ncbi:MAG TPA: hypothetical protein VF108_03040 [Actinomycetota bacterium]
MVVESRRYLGDMRALRIHDADHEHPRCRLGQLPSERRWYDDLDEALADVAYRACAWCMGGSAAATGDGITASVSWTGSA